MLKRVESGRIWGKGGVEEEEERKGADFLCPMKGKMGEN